MKRCLSFYRMVGSVILILTHQALRSLSAVGRDYNLISGVVVAPTPKEVATPIKNKAN